MGDGILDDTDGIRQAAAQWLVRLREDAGGAEHWLEFDAWLEASPRHKAAYDEALEVWSELEQMAPALKARLEHNAAPVRLVPRQVRPSGPTRWALGAAVAAAAVALAVMPFAGSILYPQQVFETARGEMRTVVLEDGSKVHMNAGSRLTVRMTRNDRQVAMNDAEAVFDVAKDAKRPFLITAGDRVVRVVGTEFDVAHRGSELAVTVRRGIVEVRPQGGGDGAVRLLPGQRLDHAVGQATRISAVNPEEAFAWRAGRLVYRNQPLSVVVAELNRHFDQPVTLADPQTGTHSFSGVLVLDDEKAVVERLSLLAPLSVAPSGAGFVLRSKDASNR
jgi:transmembrane sensor